MRPIDDPLSCDACNHCSQYLCYWRLLWRWFLDSHFCDQIYRIWARHVSRWIVSQVCYFYQTFASLIGKYIVKLKTKKIIWGIGLWLQRRKCWWRLSILPVVIESSSFINTSKWTRIPLRRTKLMLIFVTLAGTAFFCIEDGSSLTGYQDWYYKKSAFILNHCKI